MVNYNMEKDRYTYSKVSDIVVYDFFSEGPKGRIRKMVRYNWMDTEELSGRVYNLSFGDVDETLNSMDDKAVSNNLDKEKILRTVADTIIEFTKDRPNMLVFAQGNTPARNRLYQMMINSSWKEIVSQFVVLGFLDDQWLQFQKGVNYEAFLISRR